MTRQEEILYMQLRLFRLAVRQWRRPEEEVRRIFEEQAVYEYLENGYELFHVEGDAAVLAEIEAMLKTRGVRAV